MEEGQTQGLLILVESKPNTQTHSLGYWFLPKSNHGNKAAFEVTEIIVAIMPNSVYLLLWFGCLCPQNSPMKSSHQCKGIRRDFGWWLGHKGGSHVSRIRVQLKKGLQCCLAPTSTAGHSEMSKICWYLNLHFWLLNRKKLSFHCLYLTQSVILLQCLEGTKTPACLCCTWKRYTQNEQQHILTCLPSDVFVLLWKRHPSSAICHSQPTRGTTGRKWQSACPHGS